MSRVEYMKEDAFCTDKSFDIIKSVEDENGLEFYRCTEATSGWKKDSEACGPFMGMEGGYTDITEEEAYQIISSHKK